MSRRSVAGGGADPTRLTLIGASGVAARTDPCQAVYARALALWPRLDRRRLARTHGDLGKIARLVARRTVLSEESILGLLQA